MNYERELQAAIDAVTQAARLCTGVRASLVTEETLAKKDKSPVTVADFGAQALVSLALQDAFPDDPLVAEEDASALRGQEEADHLRTKVVHHVRALRPQATEVQILEAIDRGASPGGPTGRHWILDPIDGTKGFLRGDQYAVALALMEEGQVVLGVLGCPHLPIASGDLSNADDHDIPDEIRETRGCLFAATKGQGTFMHALDGPYKTPVRVTDLADVTRGRFCESVESAHSSHDDAAHIAERLGVRAEPFRIDSQCKYAAVARGDASIYLRLPTIASYEEKIWDHAAGWAVVIEAGGRISDTQGRPLDFACGRTLKNNKGVVATNAHLHDEVVKAVRAVLDL